MNNTQSFQQIDLFEHVAAAYAQTTSGRLTNDELYRIAAGRAGVTKDHLNAKTPVGRAGSERSLVKRAIRWHQQSLKNLGLIERVEDERGVWELTAAGKSKLRKVRDDVGVLAFSTNLGVAIWSNCNRTFERWDEPIFAVITSPPYPLSQPLMHRSFLPILHWFAALDLRLFNGFQVQKRLAS